MLMGNQNIKSYQKKLQEKGFHIWKLLMFIILLKTHMDFRTLYHPDFS